MQIGNIQNNASKTEQICQHQTLLSYAKNNGVHQECVKIDATFANNQKVILPDFEGIFIRDISSFDDSLAKTKTDIARRLGVSRITVFNFIKRNGLENKESCVA